MPRTKTPPYEWRPAERKALNAAKLWLVPRGKSFVLGKFDGAALAEQLTPILHRDHFVSSVDECVNLPSAYSLLSQVVDMSAFTDEGRDELVHKTDVILQARPNAKVQSHLAMLDPKGWLIRFAETRSGVDDKNEPFKFDVLVYAVTDSVELLTDHDLGPRVGRLRKSMAAKIAVDTLLVERVPAMRAQVIASNIMSAEIAAQHASKVQTALTAGMSQKEIDGLLREVDDLLDEQRTQEALALTAGSESEDDDLAQAV